MAEQILGLLSFRISSSLIVFSLLNLFPGSLCLSSKRRLFIFFMADEELVGVRFFRILMPGFSTQLLIPKDFKLGEMTTLVSPNGKLWHVELNLENRKMYMRGMGWLEFVQANNLDVGFLLILRYSGNMVFSFRAFDLSTREITYSSSSSAQTDPKMRKITNKETCSQSSSQRYHDQEVSFEVKFKAYHLRALAIPTRFIKSSGLGNDHSEISISDLMGQKWCIGVKRYMYLAIMSKGWRRFVPANKLKEGDKLIFELLPAQEHSHMIHLKMRKF